MYVLLTGLTLAQVRGIVCISHVPEFLKSLHHKQKKRIGFDLSIPDESTFRRVLNAVDPREIEQALAGWFAQEGLENRRISFDGKRLNGAHNADSKPPEMLNIVEHGTGRVLGQEIIDCSFGEREAMVRFLSKYALPGSIVTADALHTTKETLETIVEKSKAHYFFYIKKNQQIAYEYVDSLKLENRRLTAHASTFEKNRNRMEVREIYTTARNCKLKTKNPILPHAGQVGTIVRTVTHLKTNKTTSEKIHFVTSFNRTEATPEELLEMARGQWAVESKNHYVKDTSMGEDKSRCRRGYLAHCLATLRNVALKILRDVQLKFCTKKGRSTIPEARRFIETQGGVCCLLK